MSEENHYLSQMEIEDISEERQQQIIELLKKRIHDNQVEHWAILKVGKNDAEYQTLYKWLLDNNVDVTMFGEKIDINLKIGYHHIERWYEPKQPKALDTKRTTELFEELMKLKNSDNPLDSEKALKIRNEIIEGNLRLTRWLTEKKEMNDIPLSKQEKLDVAMFSVINAVDHYKLDMGANFGTYLGKVIYRDFQKVCKKEEQMKASAKEIEQAEENLYQELERKPTVEEIAGELGTTVEEIEKVKRYYEILNYSDLTEEKENLVAENNVEEEVNNNEENTKKEQDAIKQKIREDLASLTQRDKAIVEERFGLNDGIPKTLEEIGKKYDISKARVGKLLEKALIKLRTNESINEIVK